jgi:hypothetical protein
MGTAISGCPLTPGSGQVCSSLWGIARRCLSAITNHARLSVERMDTTGLNDRALVERYDALRADLDRTRDMDKRLALHRELQNLAAERQRRHPLAVTSLRS